MDMRRICKLQDDFVYVARSAAVMARSVQIVGDREKVAGIGTALATRRCMGSVVESVENADSSAETSTALETVPGADMTRDMSIAVESVLGADMSPLMRIALEQCADKGNPVYRLMHTRVCMAVKNGTIAGLHELVVPLVLELAAKVNRLININRAVHAATYDGILDE
jgi:hypothetical protein